MSFPKAIVIATLGKRPAAIQMAEVTGDSFFSDGAGTKKRRRLTHLSADEKMLRRKLKNRVAAQTARDRKKAQMQELEEKVAQLEEEKQQLLKENAQLRLNQTAIQEENALLRSQVSSATFLTPANPTPANPTPANPTHASASLVACKAEVTAPDCHAMSCKTEPECPGSAEGTDSGSVSCDDALRSLCPDLKSDALLHILEEFWGEGGEFIQPEAQAGQASPATIGQFGDNLHSVVEGAVSPQACLVGSTPANVGSINELIQSDHQYHKEEPKVVLVPDIPFSSNSVSTSLLNGKQVVTSLPSTVSPLPLKAQSTTLQQSGAISLACLAGPMGSMPRGRTLPLDPFSSSISKMSFSSSKMSMTTMVDPNMVYSPRPRVPELLQLDTSDVPDLDDSSFLCPDMLEGLLRLEDLAEFPVVNQKSSPLPAQKVQQTVITASRPPTSCSAAPAVGKSSALRKTSTPKTTRAAQPAHMLLNSKPQGLQPDPGPQECQDGYLSPDSGFISDGSDGCSSDLSEGSPSPASLTSPDMEGLSWQEDFISISMDMQLFPDVGLSV